MLKIKPEKTIVLDSFYRKGIIFTALSLLAAGVNYLLYPIISHVLEVGVFGEFTALLAIATQIGGILLAFNVISIYLVSQYGDKKSKEYLASIQKSIIIFFLIITLLCIFIFPVISGILKISSITDMLILLFIILSFIPASIWSGYFQGNGELIKVGLFSVFASISKLLLSILGAYTLGLTGALLGVLLGTVLGLILFWFLPGGKPPVSKSFIISKVDTQLIRKFYPLIIRSILAVALLSIIQIFDLLSIRALFSPTEAGQYAGLSTLSRIIYYAGFIIVWVLLPEFAKANNNQKNRLIIKSYLLYLTMTIIAGFLSYFIGENTVTYILGSKYIINNDLVTWSVIFQSAVLFVTFQTFVLMVLNRKVLIKLLTGLLGLFACSLFIDPGIENLIIGYALCTIALSIWLGIAIIKREQNEEIN
jgi:O-antigen/teichoic acid export membrane protein